MGNEKSTIVLMVQNSKKIFCYFNISSMAVKEFEDIYGENSWKNSKAVLKLYSIEDGIAKELKTIFIDAFANNWYIDVDRGDLDLFVKLGRVLPDNTFVAFSISNTITTPREEASTDTGVYFVDVLQDFDLASTVELPKCEDIYERGENHNEPRPYPFMEVKKKFIPYPKVKIKSNYYYSEFFDECIANMKKKFILNSSTVK